MTKNLLLILIFLSLSEISGFGQSQSQKKFKNTSLEKIIVEFQLQSDWSFNYDPTLIEEYQYTGVLDLTNPLHELDHLLQNTTLNYEISGRRILIFQAAEESFPICGFVKSSIDESPLPFANVFIPNIGVGTQTNEEGYFELEIKAYPRLNLQISYVGFTSYNQVLSKWHSGNCQEVFLPLNEAIFGGPIVVKDYLLQGINEGTEHSSIDMDYGYLKNQPSILQHDILRTTQLIPGVSSTDESATQLNIRGSSPDHNLILWENIPLYDPGHVFGMISSINPFVVDKVNVYKGVFNPKFENRIGGIVNISLSDSIPSRMNLGAGLTLSEGHLFLDLPLVKNRLSLLFSGRQSLANLFERPTLSNFTQKVFQATRIEEGKKETEAEDLADSSENLNYYDWNVKLIFRPIDRLTGEFSAFRSENSYFFDINFFEEALNTVDDVVFGTTAFNTNWRFNWSSDQSTQLYYRNSEYSNLYRLDIVQDVEDQDFFKAASSNEIKDVQFGVEHQWSPVSDLIIEGGYQYSAKEVQFGLSESSRFEQPFSESEKEEGHFHNIFAALHINKPNYTINGGVRSIYYQEAKALLVSPRVSIQQALSKRLKLKFSAGILYQFISQLQQFGEDEVIANNRIWVLNDARTGTFLESRKVAVGAIFQKKGWLIDLETYWNKNEGLSNINTGINDGIEIDATGEGRAKGLDVLLHKRWKKYQFNFGYSISQNEYFFLNLSDSYFPAPNDQLHKLNWSNYFQFKDWTFSVTYQYKSGLPYSIPERIVEIEENDDIYHELEFERFNNVILPDYHRWDLGLAYQKTFYNGQLKMALSFSLLNVLNRNNPFQRNYFIRDVEDEFGDEALGILFVEKSLLRRTPLFMFRMHW